MSGDAYNHVDKFTGLAGVFRQWASLGIVAMDAMFLGLAIFYLIPQQQARFDLLMQVERETRTKEFGLVRDEWRREREWDKEKTLMWQEQARSRDTALLKGIETNQKTIEALLVEIKALKKNGANEP
jgi:hypothetical protein